MINDYTRVTKSIPLFACDIKYVSLHLKNDFSPDRYENFTDSFHLFSRNFSSRAS